MAVMPGEFESGGGGLYGTAGDYSTFLRMLLSEGRRGERQILKPETVALMGENHCGAVEVAMMKSGQPLTSNDFELFPGMVKRWGLGAMISPIRRPERPQRRRPVMGRHRKLLLLARSHQARRGDLSDPDHAVRRQAGPGSERRVRTRVYGTPG